MDLETIQERLKAIRDADGNDERQHSLRDTLWREVLVAIAAAPTRHTKQDLRDLATAALQSDSIPFETWNA